MIDSRLNIKIVIYTQMTDIIVTDWQIGLAVFSYIMYHLEYR